MAVSSLARNVPVLSCGGLTKRFLVPGWRMGWIIVHDEHKRLGSAIKGLKNMCGRILGSNTIIQGALPDILSRTPQSYFDEVVGILYVSTTTTKLDKKSFELFVLLRFIFQSPTLNWHIIS